MERLLNMILRRFVNKGMNAGVRAVSRGDDGASKKTPQDRELQRQGRQTSRNVRQATRMLRRISKF